MLSGAQKRLSSCLQLVLLITRSLPQESRPKDTYRTVRISGSSVISAPPSSYGSLSNTRRHSRRTASGGSAVQRAPERATQPRLAKLTFSSVRGAGESRTVMIYGRSPYIPKLVATRHILHVRTAVSWSDSRRFKPLPQLSLPDHFRPELLYGRPDERAEREAPTVQQVSNRPKGPSASAKWPRPPPTDQKPAQLIFPRWVFSSSGAAARASLETMGTWPRGERPVRMTCPRRGGELGSWEAGKLRSWGILERHWLTRTLRGRRVSRPFKSSHGASGTAYMLSAIQPPSVEAQAFDWNRPRRRWRPL